MIATIVLMVISGTFFVLGILLARLAYFGQTEFWPGFVGCMIVAGIVGCLGQAAWNTR